MKEERLKGGERERENKNNHFRGITKMVISLCVITYSLSLRDRTFYITNSLRPSLFGILG